MKLTESEIEWLSNTPDGLRIAALYHDLRSCEGEAMGVDCSFHHRRYDELMTEAKKIETEWEK